MEALADEYATHAYDVPGYGRTGGSARGSYSIKLFADDLEAFVDALTYRMSLYAADILGISHM